MKLMKNLLILSLTSVMFITTACDDDATESNLVTHAMVGNNGFPIWYLYGEKALLERVNLLKNRTHDEPFIPQLINLDIEKLKLESSIIDMTGINVFQLRQAAVTPSNPIKQNKRLIVLIALIGSFMMSIFLALVMGVLKPDEESSA